MATPMTPSEKVNSLDEGDKVIMAYMASGNSLFDIMFEYVRLLKKANEYDALLDEVNKELLESDVILGDVENGTTKKEYLDIFKNQIITNWNNVLPG